MLKEKRYVKIDVNNKDLQTRILKDPQTGKRKLIGYGSVFNVKSRIITEWITEENEIRSFNEVIEPTAFDGIDISKNADIVLSVDHNFSQMLGRTLSGTLELFIDEKGLRYECEIPDTTLGNDVAVMVERGDFYESSFIFSVKPEGQRWEIEKETGVWIRYITQVSALYDCTICSYHGAYTQTDIEVAARQFKTLIESEEKREAEPTKEVIPDNSQKDLLDNYIFIEKNNN